ncbi:four helix bundle protein [Neolewinella xylanilytica]|uniref:Four helix bundle protein n=1 Tax=Neolewinella xylanilytica TaxID=1514080 RepID=A0A2S6I4U5_9BACT|nr:four helix bundle protein [Neolewinella xylanilytica]PPK86186.1 four helix bundle protein [Neolewinella xylanilytica]
MNWELDELYTLDFFAEEDGLKEMEMQDTSSKYGEEERSRFAKQMRDRTKKVAVELINFVERTPSSPAFNVIRFQLLKSGTSTAANYRAACRARSRAEFFAKMSIVVEETDETVFWLESLNESELKADRVDLKRIGTEYYELVKIFARARKTAKP